MKQNLVNLPSALKKVLNNLFVSDRKSNVKTTNKMKAYNFDFKPASGSWEEVPVKDNQESSSSPLETIKKPEIYPDQKKEPDQNFIKLVEENVALIKRLRNMKQQVSEAESKLIIDQTIDDIKDALELAGLERIENEKDYTPLRHEPQPLHQAAPGSRIMGTIERGLAQNNRVFLKAIVELQNGKIF